MSASPRLSLGFLVAIATVAAAGCGNGEDPAGTQVVQSTAAAAAESDEECPPPDAAGNSAIDWAPFVVVSDVQFLATHPAMEVDESALGGVVATVSCTIADAVGNPEYKIRDGDAAYLPAGTELREITGYRSDLRLAVYEDGGWWVYEAHHPDGAATGADLLDLEGKVTAVHLVEGEYGTGILRSVDEPETVAAIVEAMLAAPVIPQEELSEDRFNEPPLFVRFDLVDGSYVQRPWAVEAAVVGNELAAPEALTAALAPQG